jgi:hypothetical protein
MIGTMCSAYADIAERRVTGEEEVEEGNGTSSQVSVC